MASKRTDRGYEILNFTVDIGGGKQRPYNSTWKWWPTWSGSGLCNKAQLISKARIGFIEKHLRVAPRYKQRPTFISNSFSSKPEVSISTQKTMEKNFIWKDWNIRNKVEANKQLLKRQLEREVAQKTSFKPIINPRTRGVYIHPIIFWP